ncbi:MAG: DUF2264 domain-containing protein [Christensenellales bacterium]|jgi:hypothetical protein
MQSKRQDWLRVMDKVAWPVLSALSEGRLRRDMPVEGMIKDRLHVTHLEALGRSLAGIAPWLELEGTVGHEAELQGRYRKAALKAIEAGVTPGSPDYMNFGFEHSPQPIVDAAFLAHALLRAPKNLAQELPDDVRSNLIKAFQGLRYGKKPGFNNWLLFSAMIEAALLLLGADWDMMRVDYALRQTDAWYAGDGVYCDGPKYRWDYYNSYVIQPMYLDILAAVGEYDSYWQGLYPEAVRRSVRYAALLERLVAPDGSFPVTGRSISYRCGAFQLLCQVALAGNLPEGLAPAQVRCAMSAVIDRTLNAPGTFDENGWLKIGLAGSQPGLGEGYISTGSLYLCLAGFLPLGLAEADPFWSDPDAEWTSRKVWRGEDIPADKAYKEL